MQLYFAMAFPLVLHPLSRYNPSPPSHTQRLAFAPSLHEALIPTRVRSLPSGEIEGEEEEEVNDLGVKAALSMLRFYKREISPLIPTSCRYVPTCSEYSMEAYKRYGVVKGTVLTAWRLCRCNPLGSSGFDPPRWFDEESPTVE